MSHFFIYTDIITTSPNYVVLTIAMVCIGGLFLPTEHENSSNSRFQVSVGLKLIFSYVLGKFKKIILIKLFHTLIHRIT